MRWMSCARSPTGSRCWTTVTWSRWVRCSTSSAPQADTTRRFVETALQDKPEPEDTTRLRATYQARLVSIQIGSDNHLGTVLTDAVRRSDVHFEIVFGGITALQGRSFGNITLALSGSQDAVDQLIADLRARTGVEEIA